MLKHAAGSRTPSAFWGARTRSIARLAQASRIAACSSYAVAKVSSFCFGFSQIPLFHGRMHGWRSSTGGRPAPPRPGPVVWIQQAV